MVWSVLWQQDLFTSLSDMFLKQNLDVMVLTRWLSESCVELKPLWHMWIFRQCLKKKKAFSHSVHTTQQHIRVSRKQHILRPSCLPPWKQELASRCWCAENRNNLREDVSAIVFWLQFHLKGILEAVIVIKSRQTQIMHLQTWTVG